ncbi:MAG: hypothetical protein MUE30_11480, partial [Spirosomaceae bacterium]|nr:hypothetical protein [Spirosomataceae bacterium]
DWGKLIEAIELFRKQEAICAALGHQKGLAQSYIHQALILAQLGKSKEAMSLYKKSEGVLERIGSKDGLLINYTNQAILLQETLQKPNQAEKMLQKAWVLAKDINAISEIHQIENLFKKYHLLTPQ